MAFSEFRYPDVLTRFGLTLRNSRDLFADVPPVAPGPGYQASQQIGGRLGPGAHTEFSRSIWMVGPLLGDFWWRYEGRITLIGGAEFPMDLGDGLTGVVDFVIGLAPQQTRVVAPILVIFEAKRDSIPDGLAQCIAGMVAAQRYNHRSGTPLDPIYGCVTTGSQWKFFKLSGTTLTQDLTEYQYGEASKLLGILTHMVGPAAEPVAA